MKTRLARMVVAAGVLVLVASACGKNDNKAATTTKATTGGTATTGGGTASTGAAAGNTLKVDSSKCPADATKALAAGEDIKIGITLPQSGQLAAFGVIGQGMKMYFDKVNAEEGGVDGHKIQLIAKDDSYDPNKTPALVQELLEKDKVLGTVFQVGTPNVGATRKVLEESCTAQAFVGTGFPAWGDPANHPWTVGGILAYNTEAKIWADFISKKKPGAKVAELTFNNDFGKAYSKQIAAEAKDKGFSVVVTKLHEGTATSIDNEITAILAENPDVVLGETTAAFCPKFMAGLAAGGYQGITILSSTCSSVAQFFRPVDPAGDKVYLVGQVKDVTDDTYANDDDIKAFKDTVAKYGAGLDAGNLSVGTGYIAGYLTVDVLKRAAKMEGGLTRVNFMNAVWATDLKVPLSLGGKLHLDGKTDAYGSEYAVMQQYDAAKGSLVKSGDTFDLEGKTGVYQPS